ncbi:MarR family EPS-associated transcriptional regulator [Marinomonas ostreistagni]|uniref:MarR family EPS-associated transcriptional regulator n=1 Tax=Marinomonas ostreistagni TaxID=359209 RepID=UPI00194E1EFF|nr:MarR family EPS-associated transcriptional regulator [Marinomonas ostreistagni]MBM6551044.1 MarR family EPS-associated transcriptional regulator [Marinomonas ostreistagni]
MLNDEYRLKILKAVEADPQISQRELAKQLGISLGKTNFCLKALIEKGQIKAENFKNNPNKSGYWYLLTLSGIEEKAALTKRFLARKLQEHEELTAEIEVLRREVLETSSHSATQRNDQSI